MPFPGNGTAYTRANVEALAGGQAGCYGLFHTKWVYIGQSGDLRQRLLEHLPPGDNSCINREKPTHFITVLSNNPEQKEKELLMEIETICNKKIG